VTLATTRLDVAAEVAAITATLAARRDPSYEWGMRRTVPSAQPAHATRIPDVRKTVSEWRRAHKGLPTEALPALCDALWATGWREERIVAIDLLRRDKKALAAVDWQRLADWSADIDNWEQVDHLADVSGRRLVADPTLASEIDTLAASDNPWQRRLALVTLIVAFRLDERWRRPLRVMADSLRKDPHPLVRRAVVWARDRLAKDHLDG
jgi:3-methyladenine DNA glycosylase AlkD